MVMSEILESYNPIPSVGCWIWDRALFKDGYGLVWYEGKIKRAHRVFYEHYRGKIPDGLCVCHSCDTRACVNPAHLWVGTKKDNTQDMIKKGRENFEWMKLGRGPKDHSTRLTAGEVVTIKSRISKGEKVAHIARDLSLSYNCVWQIKVGTRWGHIQ